MRKPLTDPTEWTLIGHVGVDAGMIHIGDPCYINEDDDDNTADKVGLGRNYAKNWSKFCDWFFENQDEFGNAKVPYPMGHEGRAVVVGGFGGDGSYGVYMRRGRSVFGGEITTQILIDFAGELDEEGDDDEETHD